MDGGKRLKHMRIRCKDGLPQALLDELVEATADAVKAALCEWRGEFERIDCDVIHWIAEPLAVDADGAVMFGVVDAGARKRVTDEEGGEYVELIQVWQRQGRCHVRALDLDRCDVAGQVDAVMRNWLHELT